MTRVLALLFLVGCSSTSGDPASIAGLDYEVPKGWTSRNYSGHQHQMFEWTPAGDNARKESVIVIRADRPALAKASPAQLGRILEDAQRGLSKAQFSRPSGFQTYGGFNGLVIEGEFIATATKETYYRKHAVFFDGTAVVSVLYTAREVDRENADVHFRRGG